MFVLYWATIAANNLVSAIRLIKLDFKSSQMKKSKKHFGYNPDSILLKV
jgi:hypothetical protein